jgi:AcrR family transcriptional regulator
MSRRPCAGGLRAVFAEQGIDVSMREIPRRAGLSEPTLRRSFESKEALVAEPFDDKITTYADLAEAALENPDALGRIRVLRDAAGAHALGRSGFADMLTMTFPPSMRYEKEPQGVRGHPEADRSGEGVR